MLQNVEAVLQHVVRTCVELQTYHSSHRHQMVPSQVEGVDEAPIAGTVISV